MHEVREHPHLEVVRSQTGVSPEHFPLQGRAGGSQVEIAWLHTSSAVQHAVPHFLYSGQEAPASGLSFPGPVSAGLLVSSVQPKAASVPAKQKSLTICFITSCLSHEGLGPGPAGSWASRPSNVVS